MPVPPAPGALGRVAYLLPDPGIPVGGTKGAAVHVDALCGAMVRSGVSVSLYAAKVVGPLSSRGADRVEVVPVDVGTVGSGEDADRSRIRACGRFFDQVSDLLEHGRPDWIHERLSLFAGAGNALAARLGIPRIVEVNAPVAEERRRHFSLSKVAEAARAERDALSEADVVAVSGPLVDWSLAMGAASAVVVPNGADTDWLDRMRWQHHGAELRAGLGFADCQLVLGFAGSLKPWHGVEVLVDAVRQASRGADVGLLVVGDGPRRDVVAKMARDLPDSVRVAMTGSVPAYEVPRYLAAMDVAVAPYLPSQHFYFSPLKVAEAMAASLPVVASDFPPVRELLGGAGSLVPPGDVDALAGALWQLAVEPDTRARMATEGRSRAVASLDWTAVARRTIEVAAAAAGRHQVSA